MQTRYLEVTFHRGKPLAAYLSLPRREGDQSARVTKFGPGLVVDEAVDGRPIGIEIAIPHRVSLDAINNILSSYGLDPIDATELGPLGQAA